MRPTYTRLLAATFGMLLGTLPAQTAPDTTDAAVAANAKAQGDALKLRADTVDAITGGGEKSEAVLVRLKAHASPSGLKLDADADFAYAAIDLGQRLLAAGRPEEAEIFFKQGEKSLDLTPKF